MIPLLYTDAFHLKNKVKELLRSRYCQEVSVSAHCSWTARDKDLAHQQGSVREPVCPIGPKVNSEYMTANYCTLIARFQWLSVWANTDLFCIRAEKPSIEWEYTESIADPNPQHLSQVTYEFLSGPRNRDVLGFRIGRWCANTVGEPYCNRNV